MSRPARNAEQLRAALLARSIRHECGCRLWLGALKNNGYGTISVNGKPRYAHRVSYTVFVGPIPDEHEIDHVAARGCRFRHCIEPTHLEPVKRRENLLRPNGWAGRHARKTHCPKGHPLVDGNLEPWQLRNGARQCLTCTRAREAERTARRRAARERAKCIHA